MPGVRRRGAARPLFILFLFLFAVAMWLAAPAPAQTGQPGAFASDVERLVSEFRAARAGSELKIQKALEISQSYEARMLLKQDRYANLGAEYHDLMKGAPERPGFLQDVITDVEGNLRGKYSAEVLAQLQLIENEASRAARKAPMDFDIGILVANADTPAGRARLLALRKQLGGPAAVAAFHADLQAALESSYVKIAQNYGVKVDPKMAFLTGTTPWHAEAYLSSEVLKAGGVPSPSLLQQTADVTKFKTNHFRNMFLEAIERGQPPPTWAIQEMARGTLKDVEKVEAVFDHVGSLTGTRPSWKPENSSTIDALEELASGRGDPVRIFGERFAGPEGFSQACSRLIDNMEAAVVLASPPLPQILKARLYRRYLNGETLTTALHAVANSDPSALPAAARALDDKLARVLCVRLVTLEATSADEFLGQLRKQWSDLPFTQGDDVLRSLIDNVDSMPERGLAALVGDGLARQIERVRTRLDPAVRRSLAGRVSRRVSLTEADGRSVRLARRDPPGTTELGPFDVIVGVATALAETSAIYDLELSPDEERRRVMNAWVSSTPILGDFASAIITGTDVYASWKTDPLQVAEAVTFLAIGTAAVVPGGQVVAVVLSLGMLGKAVVGSWWAAQQDKDLIQAWVDSGSWDRNQGRLLGVHDTSGGVRAVDPPDAAFGDLYTNGGAAYHTGLAGQTIRATLLDFVERTRLTADPRLRDRVGATELAIANMYPAFKPRDALREPAKVGRVTLWNHIKAKGDNPQRSPAMALYVQLENLYESAVRGAIAELKTEAEAEYQARFLVGEAKTVFDQLTALELRLRLPLTAHVKEIEESFLAFTAEWIKAQWDRHSLPVRRVERARQYVQGYSEAEQTMRRIGQLYAKAGVPPPGDYHLSGYLPIDGPRLASLEQAYTAAIATAGRDALELARLAELKGDLTHPCIADLYRQLAQARIHITRFNDQRLLYAEWSGKAEAARAHRDIALQRALDRVALNDPVPVVLWRDLSEAFESELAWSRGAWGAEQVFREGAARYAQVSRELQQSITEREMQYSDLRIRGRQMLLDCATKPSEPAPTAPPAARPSGQAASPRDACVQSARSGLESARAQFERVKTIETWRLEAAQPFVCGPNPWFPCMSETHQAVFKEVDGRDPINQWGYAEAPGCSFVSMKSTEYNRCAWQQYLKKLEVLTERRIQACESK